MKCIVDKKLFIHSVKGIYYIAIKKIEFFDKVFIQTNDFLIHTPYCFFDLFKKNFYSNKKNTCFIKNYGYILSNILNVDQKDHAVFKKKIYILMTLS